METKRFIQKIAGVILIMLPLLINAQGLNYQLKSDSENQLLISEIDELLKKSGAEMNKDGQYVFKSFAKANAAEQQIRELGHDVYVQAFFNLMKISIEDALAMEDDQSSYDEQVITRDNINSMGKSGKKLELFYTIEIGISSYKDVDALFEYLDGMAIKVRNDNQGGYIIGEYVSMDEAKAARMKLLRADVGNVFIVAYLDQERISAIAAAELEEFIKGKTMAATE